MEKKASAEKAVREIRRKTRRKFASEEKVLLQRIKDRILDPEIITVLIEKLLARINTHVEISSSELEHKKKLVATLKSEVDNLTRFILGGDNSDAVRAALREKEIEIKSIGARLAKVDAVIPKENREFPRSGSNASYMIWLALSIPRPQKLGRSGWS